ncbi:PAQR family membrane homeostasis protein TrhA [Plastoroseomonas arctica]|uniref:Hemolysin III family protein n=1 Tax=Plastoroseomonas arctica TaxID=1509237 RepID=A0AAF1JUY0_9PROT|nr:hemolysin III family protein [Plastoroseomonas arctica]MBR0654004.1 hemolysin III family protein [Plastoroseomonas arctica]
MDGYVQYSPAERVVDATIHAVAIAAALVGFVALAWQMPWPPEGRIVAALAVYAVGLLAMLVSSAAYNAVRGGPAKAVLRRVDHAAIFVMIAGTYTPMMVLGLGGGMGFGMLGAVWAGALGGAVLTVALGPRFERFAIAAYLALGWCGFLLIGRLWDVLTTAAFALLLSGGVLYSVGVVAHTAHRMRFHNALWHAMVMAGAACHFVVVLLLVRAARG